ncbi:hypothetical protein ACWIID_14825 [Streptomyces phaeochromogenes]
MSRGPPPPDRVLAPSQRQAGQCKAAAQPRDQVPPQRTDQAVSLEAVRGIEDVVDVVDHLGVG